jgi:hypothetical protein
MKTFTSFGIIILLALLSASCKKSPSGTQIQYKIVPADVYIIQYNYTDQTGQQKSINDISQVQNGTETIQVTQKPFDATFDVKINNSTNAARYYTVLIYVDGQIKSFNNFSAPAMTSLYDEQIEYMLN